MNILDVIKQQLAGEVTKKLGGMAGISESDLQKTLGASLPGLLSGLGAMASTKQGAGKIAEALGGMDSNMFGDLAGILGSGAMQKGGGMLAGLLGGGVVDGLASMIAKVTGINETAVKTALGYLAPLVLGAIGSTFRGSKPSADGISRLFAEQQQNIASAMPAGMNLDNIPGFKSLSSAGAAAASVAKAAPAAAKSGLGSLLVPLLILAAVVAGLYWYVTRPSAEPQQASAPSSLMPESTEEKPTTAVEDAKEAVAGAVDAVTNALPNIPNVPTFNLDEIKTKFTGWMDQFGGDLGKITDVATADAALPGLKDLHGKLDAMSKSMSLLPAEAKSMFGELAKGQLEKLNPIIEKITAIPNIGDAIKQILTQLKEKLTALVGP